MKLNFPKLKAVSRKLKSAADLPRRSVAKAGIALVITLIMISVIAFMAITFLVLSQRERGSVSVIASQTDARLAAETALQTATAKLLAPVIAYTNPFNYDLLVSTNYINPAGFDTAAAAFTRYTNVNYDYLTAGGPVSGNNALQNIANLLYDPRPPVFITNKTAASSDFRYYLDLNRNGRPDASGFLPETNNLNALTGNTNYYVGDPEWIGILERPELPHSSSNKFIARYAYLAVPAGKTLDLNYIHNQAKRIGANNDGFLRNQGVGSWELNLASFLVDLNTNEWMPPLGVAYNYNPGSAASSGSAFEDALALVRYRYNGNYANLTNPVPLVDNGGIDEYANGNITGALMTGTSWNNDFNDTGPGYPGADNPNHFFTTQDLFDPAKSSSQFVGRLAQAGAANSSYDRYTFSRLLSQLGTDSSAESGKLNLNYRNVSNGVVVPDLETKFLAWTPVEFFTNVAGRLLLNLTNEAEYKQAFGNRQVRITNIMIWPQNDYTPAVHRTLQLAANLYDATTNGYPLGNNLFAPSVFRPVFNTISTNVFIVGYEEVTNTTVLISTNTPMRDLNNPNDRAALLPTDMVYGIPLVIGAKKGFPSFNALGLQTAVRATRKLQVYRPTTNDTPNEIRQVYLLSISNIIAVAGWNSYSNKYPLDVQLIVAADVTSVLTNESGVIPIASAYGTGVASNRYSVGVVTNIAANAWAGFVAKQPKYSFQIPLTNLFLSLANCSWQSTAPASAVGTFIFPPATNFTQQGLTPPHWSLNVSTRLRFIMVDTATSRILDYVNLTSDAATLDITQELMHGANCDANTGNDNSAGGAWCTNKPATYPPYTYVPTYGILNQLGVSRGSIPVNAVWKSYIDDPTTGNDVAKSVQNFSAFMNKNPGTTNLVMQAPFSPTRTIYQYVSWQVNDPLVHYIAQDLTDLLGDANKLEFVDRNNLTPKNSPVASIGAVTEHYRPWGGNPNKYGTDTTPATAYHLELKDPKVGCSDDWDFPTNALPNLGWLGRVHRGTPWQTIYLKSATVDTDTWEKWTGNTDKYDSALAQPEKDRHLFDLFTTTPNANATRGQLPINQTNLAAWSAALSGVIALQSTNANVVIQPAAVSPELQAIVTGINNWRTNAGFNGIGGSFTNLGGILAVPELTLSSPYFSNTNLDYIQSGFNTNITEAVIERLPQQIMSLLRLGDQLRFVVYAYGQSLKPADRSIVPSGPYVGLCTNYQITGETAIRAVVRVEGAGVNDPKPYQPHVIIESYNNLPPD